MGQNNSSISMHKHTRRKSLRSSFLRRSSKSDLSATFTMLDNDKLVDLLNVNLATEEELMTLPGVSRTTARNIVEHRKAIGRFKKVEDVALVKGVGADRLDQIRGEICVSKRRNQSCASSRAQSMDSLDSRSYYKAVKLVDINKANVFDLQCVHGVTQEIAANIVLYRDKKKSFKRLEDLLKVRGIDTVRFSNIRPYLTAGSDENYESSCTRSSFEVTANGGLSNGSLLHTPIVHKKVVNNVTKLSSNSGLSSSSVCDIFELLSAYSCRPIPEEEFSYERNGETAFRIATWNLHELCLDKAHNLGFREVVCRTVLENRWSIVAVQEVYDSEALRLICDELNKPALRRIGEWKDNSRKWNFCMSDVANSQLGFLYDCHNQGPEVELFTLNHILIDSYESLVAEFKAGSVHFTLVNINLPDNGPSNMEQKFKEFAIDDSTRLLILGDFSAISRNLDENREIGNFQAVLPLAINTSCVNFKTVPSCRYSDNIFVNSKVKGQLTGVWGVVRQGLTHLAIPWGWNWGGPASPHCPVWIELFANPDLGTAL